MVCSDFGSQGTPSDSVTNASRNVQDKYQDVLRLEASVAQLHEMFVDFAQLTEQQGELLDQIEFQVLHTYFPSSNNYFFNTTSCILCRFSLFTVNYYNHTFCMLCHLSNCSCLCCTGLDRSNLRVTSSTRVTRTWCRRSTWPSPSARNKHACASSCW
jgi:hypothetical protein